MITIIGAIAASVGAITAVVGVVLLLYNRKESRENMRDVLQRAHKELTDNLDDIKKGKAELKCEDPVGNTTSFLNVEFFYADCERLLNSSEIRGLDTNKIKEVISTMKTNNKILEEEISKLPTIREDEELPSIEDVQGPDLWENCKKMKMYQDRLVRDIPYALAEIKKVCDQLS